MKNFTTPIHAMGSKANQKNISIVTLNTLGTPFFAPDITKRYKRIAQYINEKEYDIVCLQELFSYYHLFLFKKNLANFPYVIYQKNPFGPRGGLAIFSKFELTDKEFFTYTFPIDTHISPYIRLAQPGILSATVKQFRIKICTTHLSSDIDHNLSPKNKLYKLIRNQTEEAAIAVNSYTKNNNSLILTGDFNIAKNSQLYKILIANSTIKDIFYEKNRNTYDPDRIAYFYKAQADICDYIFIKSQKQTLTVADLNYAFFEKEKLMNGKKSYLSDHIGLHCILSVNE